MELKRNKKWNPVKTESNQTAKD